MADKLYGFNIPVSWSEYSNLYVEARDLDHAIKLASDAPLQDGEYEDGSFHIDYDLARDRNEDVLKQIEKDKQPLNNIVDNAFPKKG